MAAKMLDFRRPKRTRTESAAQPIADPMATISANKGAKFDLDPSELSNKPSAQRFATATTASRSRLAEHAPRGLRSPYLQGFLKEAIWKSRRRLSSLKLNWSR